MEKIEIKSKYELLMTSSLLIFCLLLIIVIIFFAVRIQNDIKAGQYIGQDVQNINVITATGVGDVNSNPDLAQITFSVISNAKTVSEAMADNTKKMNTVIAFVKGQGVEDKDMTTASFNISPTYDYVQGLCTTASCPQSKRVLSGYEVDQSLQVKIRDLSKIGVIIEGATAAGANQTGDLQFTIDDQDSLVAQARVKAIAKAKAQASQLASQLGVRLVRITGYNEGNNIPSPVYSLSAKAMDTASVGAEAPSIQIGQNKTEVSVSITYEIR
jgi:uncharacterized protein YggE